MPDISNSSSDPQRNIAGVPLPPPAQVWRAIELYLALAYEGVSTPHAVQQRLDELHHQPADHFYDAPVLEHDADAAGVPSDKSLGPRPKFRLRLGNSFYPHMKLILDPRPDGQGYLFRADTHDLHCCPAPASPEYQIFRRLMQQNQQLAGRIEQAWDAAGLPTFKSFLRADLSRRCG